MHVAACSPFLSGVPLSYPSPLVAVRMSVSSK
jgi:hypothetical protein